MPLFVNIVAAESFPTSTRALAIGLANASTRVSALLAQFVNASLMSEPASLLIVTAAFMVIGALTSCALEKDKTREKLEN